jgi:hypothetical protein
VRKTEKTKNGFKVIRVMRSNSNTTPISRTERKSNFQMRLMLCRYQQRESDDKRGGRKKTTEK